MIADYEQYRQLRATLFMRQFNGIATALDLAKYERLMKIDTPIRNLTADAYKFWRRVKKAAGIEKREVQVAASLTQEAEVFP